ncbi:hypothetical protein LJ739_03000 [Aestuariibacter halophilus]|uniref:DUF4234 domain-containing protein n=1 Tax=Fluctibacter halophilus TaxID=226011 RepID=A0ABS8G5S7_9ALTE|nr:hypothetical protein [Aestuariibacter halophilus]MCC2615210.1 hypothetical protein [Aestuariibacter halophilus]
MKSRAPGYTPIYITALLCVLSMGCYLFYMLYRLSVLTNRHTEHRISIPFMLTVTTLFGLSLASLCWAVVVYPDLSALQAHLPLHVVSSFLDMLWILRVRKGLQSLWQNQRGDDGGLSPVLSSMFHVVYFQHKINQRPLALDEQ